MNQTVDLHSHTTASDGTYTPEESVMRAKEKGLRALGVTDHDTVEGIRRAIRAGEKVGVEIVPGVELSSVDAGRDIHVLGYYIKFEDQNFLNRLSKLRNVRNKRNEMLVARLNELGIPITIEEVRQKCKMKDGNVGRPHFAEVLVDKGIVGSIAEAFDIYLGEGGKAYVNPPRMSPEEAISIIKNAGGVPVLAHPGIYDNEGLIERLLQNGLEGIEVYHPDHTDDQEKYFSKLANRYGVVQTGGSDFHGERNGVIFHGDLGSKTTSYETVIELRERARKIREEA